MLAIGDVALHQKTGHFGTVVGYGHEILDGIYITTLKVRVTNFTDSNKRSFIQEDLCSVWTQRK